MHMSGKLITTAAAIACAASFATAQLPGLDAQLVTTGLNNPTGLFHAPGDDSRLYVTEKWGQIRVIENGTLSATPFLDIRGPVGTSNSTFDERGLLGLAFHPDFENNGTFFVNYTNNSGNTVIEKYQATSPDSADASSGDIIMTFGQPFSNHNGGWIEFGPNDGYLYIATGDGGSGNDPGNRAQDITNQRLGKILRIDVDGDDFPGDANRDYAIPPSNPFVGQTGDDEIWSWGLRNPWRNAFDRETGDLFIADVGQSSREEINFVPASFNGGNFGWRCLEGFRCTGLSGCNCSDSSLIDPIHDYTRNLGISVTGGRIYRGCAIPDLDGVYFFADYGSGRVWAGRVNANGTAFEGGGPTQIDADLEETSTLFNISSFGEDNQGEIYIVSQSGGRVFRIVPDGGIVDENNNGIADSCEASICLGDCNDDGVVNFSDLTAMLFAFGDDDAPAACDADESGTVNFSDLTATLFAFGPCE